MNKLRKVMNKLYASHKQVVKKLLMSHEQVPAVVMMRQAKLLFRVYGVWCRMVVPYSCENKAISAPSWGLAGWGLG